MQNIAGNLLTLGITTKGRVDELVETLRLIEASELKSCPIILIDDGGGGQFIQAAEFDLDLHIYRYEKSQGLVARRNELTERCKTKYLMSLDDDSAPESGSIDDVLDLLETNEDVAAVALNLYNEASEHLNPSIPNFITRYYVGCGHIYKVAIFKKLGGYSGDLFYGHEEREYALKLARESLNIIHINHYIVKHRKSDINRVVGYNARMSRNLGWINGTYLGILPNIIELYSFLKGKKINQVSLVLKDYFDGMRARKRESKLTFSHYLKWKRKKTPTVA